MPTQYRKLQVIDAASNVDFRSATELVSVPLVAPASNEIRVRHIYVGVNAADIGVANRYCNPTGSSTFDIGLEAIGIIDAIGSKVGADERGFRIGQPVAIFFAEKAQGFAEYSYNHPDSLVPIPSLAPEYLGALSNGLTATLGIDKVAQLLPGDKVLVTAAAGGTGQIVCQWAKQKGAFVIGLTSSAAKAAYLREQLGVDEVINYRDENLDQVLSEKFPQGIDVIWETIGGNTCRTLFGHLAAKGRLVLVGSTNNYGNDCDVCDVPIEGLNANLLFGARSLRGFALGEYYADIPEYLPMLVSAIESGSLKVQLDFGDNSISGSSNGGRFVGLEQVYRAQEWLAGGKNLGKVVVQLQKV